MSETKTFVQDLTGLVEMDRASVDMDTVEGRIAARAVMAQGTYQSARQKLVDAMVVDGESVEFLSKHGRVDAAVKAEVSAHMWTLAHEIGLLAAVNRAARELRNENFSSSASANASDAVKRDELRRFLSDVGYLFRHDEDDTLEAEVKKEIASVFLF